MKNPFARKNKTDLAKAPKGFARHGRIRVQSKGGAIGGLLVKGLAAVLGATIAVAGFSIWDISNSIRANGIELKGPKVTAADLKGPINMLLIGSDSRAGTNSHIFGNETSVLADVEILIHISADRKNAVALSFPRDLMVPWPACPSTSGGSGYLPQALGQINATIANGGAGCTLLTIQQLTGVTIPYLATINFGGVIEMSNAIGGVDVCVARPIHDQYTFLNLAAGNHNLKGMQALQFLRTRHGVGDGSDLSRISNQQVFLTSLLRKIKSEGVLSNPIQLYSLATAAARNMQLSTSLTDINTMIGIASALKSVDLQKMTFLQVPSHGGLPAPYSGRVMPNYDQANLIFQKLVNDEPIIIDKANTGSGAVAQGGSATATPTPAPTKSSTPGTSASPSATPTPTATALPEWARGTNAATTTCSG
jgi:LCP family protein required for cell wall assembly